MRKSFILPLLLFISTLSLIAQKEYSIESVTVINLGDGRLLYRDATTEEPLSGQHRLMDGYRSEYILADFKDGLYDGTFKHFRRNLLTTEADYKEGVKEGISKVYYGDGETVQTESSFVAGKLDGLARSYDQRGRLEQENGFKAGNAHGYHRVFNPETGEVRKEENYVNGKLEGKAFSYIRGNNDYVETSYYKDGLREGSYEKVFLNGVKGEAGTYKNGKKTGPWIKLNADGDSLEIKTYDKGELNGLSVDYFKTGSRSKAYMYKNGKRDGKCIDYDNKGNFKKITHYKENREHGTVQIWMTSSGFDYIETTTWENGKRNGKYEAVYRKDDKRNIKEGTLKEKGQYKNGQKVGIWSYYDTEGKLTREVDADK